VGERRCRRCRGRNMALSLAPHNIRVNAIGPGSIMTPVLAAVASDRAAMNRRAAPARQGIATLPCVMLEVCEAAAAHAVSTLTRGW